MTHAFTSYAEKASDTEWLNQQSTVVLSHLLPAARQLLDDVPGAEVFYRRLRAEFPRFFRLMFSLYGDQHDFYYHLQVSLMTAARSYIARDHSLKIMDETREAEPFWFQSNEMIGAVCYVDLFAGDLAGLHDRIPYLKDLGITYLHLMPLFDVPASNSDGGYAVRNYRQVREDIGTMQQLAALAGELRREGISLVLDFIFNHTSNRHDWAERALRSERPYRDFYYFFPDRELPDRLERNLRQIFPEQAPGNFTYLPDHSLWVWTSFYDFQWDLNYRNPAVFNAMLGEMLYLANQGVEIFRLDAVAFIWKEIGTSCENLPQAHMIIQAYNTITRMVCPGVLFKSEAIVHPDMVRAYIGWDEAPLSYNPTMMALLWEALATRDVDLLQLSMSKRFELPADNSWVNYLRVHDDIGWTFADEDAAELNIDGYSHRQFLNRFYTGRFDGSFAMGVPFGVNASTGDMRVSGTTASLAGLELALKQEEPDHIEYAIRRILMAYSVVISTGGIPLIYLGDEIGTLNDYDYLADPEKRDDSRWVHRPGFDWPRYEAEHSDYRTIGGRIFQTLRHLIHVRKRNSVFVDGSTLFFDTGNSQVLGYLRNRQLLVLCNFSETPQVVSSDVLAAYAPTSQLAVDLVTGSDMLISGELTIVPYGFHWLLFHGDVR